jgi:hypothetical protein
MLKLVQLGSGVRVPQVPEGTQYCYVALGPGSRADKWLAEQLRCSTPDASLALDAKPNRSPHQCADTSKAKEHS